MRYFIGPLVVGAFWIFGGPIAGLLAVVVWLLLAILMTLAFIATGR